MANGVIQILASDATITIGNVDFPLQVSANASGSGDMLAANNLSDVASAETSRDNLGLGTAATTDADDYATPAQLSSHAADASAHHARYADSEAVSAMGTEADGNPLNHARYTDSEAKSAAAQLTVEPLGTLSGATAIDWDAAKQVQTATVNGTAVELTKGTGWPDSDLADVVLLLTVSSATAITWTIIDQEVTGSELPDSLAAGSEPHHILLRSIGGTIYSWYGGGPE